MSEVNLPKNIFAIKVNTQAIFDTILSERASKRSSGAQTKNQSQVSGTGKKPWAQKGTGRARAGSLRSTTFVGGATYGPRGNQNFNLKVNKKVRKLALYSALTLKAKDGSILVNDFKLEKPSTKKLLSAIQLITKAKKVLIVTENENVFKSASNLQKVVTIKLLSLSVESIVNSDVVIFETSHIKTLEGGNK